MTHGVTFVLTSCGRFDLLEKSLTSFFAHNRAKIDRYIVIEDSGDERVRKLTSRFPEIEVMVNAPRLGQLASIDRAYAGVGTGYVFHTEDDWTFYRSGFIEESLILLERFPQVSMVGVRRTGGDKGHDRMVLASPVEACENIAFR